MDKVGESGAAAEDPPLMLALAHYMVGATPTGSPRGNGKSLYFILCAPDWLPSADSESHRRS